MTQELRERVAHLFRTMYATEADRHIAADAVIAIIRAEVLEEAAQCVQRQPSPSSDWIAEKVRALKEKP